MTREEILRDFRDLTGEDIQAGLAFAADRERQLLAVRDLKLLFDQNLPSVLATA